MQLGFESKTFTHGHQLLVIDGVILSGTFASLAGFPEGEKEYKKGGGVHYLVVVNVLDTEVCVNAILIVHIFWIKRK